MDVDPLDAFMAGIEAEVSNLKKTEATNSRDSLNRNTTNNGANKKRSEIVDSDEEVVGNEDLSKNLTAEELIALAQKKAKKQDLGFVDHAVIKYLPFRKDFYVECSEISRMTTEEVAAYRNELDGIKIRGLHCPKPIRKWTQCGLDSRILEVIRKCGYEKPTPIQAQSIPAIMSGRDIIGIAKTGSGKTIAFLLPMFRHILDQPLLGINDGPIALIMTPTRELALQTHNECRKFAKVLNLRVVCAYGGAPIKDQIADLRRGAEIVICTPGRFTDLLLANSGRVTNLKRVTYLVLDEADRMFDLGFGPQVQRIIGNIRPDKQVVLFSATFPVSMEGLARKILVKPLEIVVGLRSTVSSDIEQIVEVVEESAKFLKLLDVLGRWYETKSSRILIFVERQDTADSLLRDLARRGYPCNSLHGGKDQDDRDCAIADFKQGNIPIIIATSVAARGLDVKDLKLVINYECPNHKEDYVHRVGRTGRAGNKGTAITFITPDQEKYAPEVVKALFESGVSIPTALKQLAESYIVKLKNGQVAAVGSGFGGKGLERIDQGHEKLKKTRKFLLGNDDDLSSGDEEDILAAISTPATERKTEADTSTMESSSERTRMETPRSSVGLTSEARVALQRLNARLKQNTSSAETEAAASDVLAAINARYRVPTNPSGEIMAIYDRPAAPGIPPVARSYFAELEVNDFPQMVRFKITHKDTLTTVMEFCGVQLLVKGEYIAPGRPSAQRKLYVRIDGQKESSVAQALKELRRLLLESLTQEFTAHESSRYGISM